MNLLLFLQTGLLFSANRWKVALSKNKPLLWLCGIFYVIAPLLEKPNSMWAAPLFFYLFILMADLMSADAGGVFANSGERFRCIVFATGFTKKGGERRLSEGVFIKAKGLHIVDMFPVTDCRERLLDERTLIIKPKDFSSCCLYSAAYPKGLILGEAVDDALVFFYSKKAKMLRVAEPGLLGKVSGIAGVAAGDEMMSDFWGEATYVELDGGESIDAAEYDSFCDAYRVDETRFLRAEQNDGSCLVFEALFSNGEAVAAFRVENVPEIFFADENGSRKRLHYDAEKHAYAVA